MLIPTSFGDDYTDQLQPIVVEEVAAYVFNSRNALIDDTKILTTLRAATSSQYPCSGGCTESLIAAGFAAADQLQVKEQFFAGVDETSVTSVMAYIQNSLRSSTTVWAMVNRMRGQAVNDRLKTGSTIYTERVIAEAFRRVSLAMKPTGTVPGTIPVTPLPDTTPLAKPGFKPALVVLFTTLSLGLVVGAFVWLSRGSKASS